MKKSFIVCCALGLHAGCLPAPGSPSILQTPVEGEWAGTFESSWGVLPVRMTLANVHSTQSINGTYVLDGGRATGSLGGALQTIEKDSPGLLHGSLTISYAMADGNVVQFPDRRFPVRKLPRTPNQHSGHDPPVTSDAMKTSILGLAMALTAACSPSGLESVAIGTELVAKGLKAAKEVDEYLKKERPQAAVVIMNRHLKEIDAAIATVKNDPMISTSDKAAVLIELQKYRTGHERDLDKLRAFANMHSEVSVH